MKSEIEKLIRQKWYFKSASKKTMTAKLACKCDGREYVANLKFNEMFDQFDIGDGNEPIVSEILAEEKWWQKVQPILDGDTKETGEGLTREWIVPVTFSFVECATVEAESAEEAEKIARDMDIEQILETSTEFGNEVVTVSLGCIRVSEYGNAEVND